MKVLTTPLLAFALFASSAAASAEPLPQCDLDGAAGTRDFRANPEVRPQTGYVRKLKNVSTQSGQPVAKGEPVLMADVDVVQHTVMLRPYEPFKYSANLLAVSFRYDPNVLQASAYKFHSRSGEVYHVLMYTRDMVFVRADGRPCNRVGRYSNDSSGIIAYTYKTDPEDVRFTFSEEERSMGAASLRIIYMGTTAGAMQFQEVWARDGRILEGRPHRFDQFAKSVKIAGFRLLVEDTLPESAVLTVETLEDLPLSMDEAMGLVLSFSR